MMTDKTKKRQARAVNDAHTAWKHMTPQARRDLLAWINAQGLPIASAK